MTDWKALWLERRAQLGEPTDAFRWYDSQEITVDAFADVAVLSV